MRAFDAARRLVRGRGLAAARPRFPVPAGSAGSLVPAGFRLGADAGTRLIADGSVLVGGSPVRVLRLTPAGTRQVAGWLAGALVPDDIAARTLARRLLDAGIAHPVFAPSGAHPRYLSNRRQAAPTSASTPPSTPNPTSRLGPRDVTVVIPVRDRHGELARCLGGLRDAAAALGDAAPGVIVVDDCSADPGAIEAIVAGVGARTIRREVNGGPAAARNTGLAAATTELVAFLDSDCVPRAGWLDGLLPHFADPAVGAVAPRIVPHEAGTTWLARYEGASSTLDMGARPSIVRPGSRVSYVPGAALVVRRSAAGAGFTEGMFVGEDVDFVWRMAAVGWRVRYEPAAVMGHDHRVRLRAWFSRRADYGTSAAALEQLHPGNVRPLYASWWTVGAWAAALAGRPATGAALAGTATALLARRLSRITGERWPLPAPSADTEGATTEGATTEGATTEGATTEGATTEGATTEGAITEGADPADTECAAWRLAVRLAGGGTLAAARPLGSALSRAWWPLAIPAAIAVPRLRMPIAALILAPPLLDWADRRPPLDPARYVAARLVDDAAYSLGVWQGCLRRRTLRPLLPSIGARARSHP